MGRYEKDKESYENRGRMLVAEVLKDEEGMIAEGKIFGVMAYLSILCLVPIVLFSILRMVPVLSKKINRFAVFHVKQGFVVFLLEVAIVALRLIPILGQIVFAVCSPVLFLLSAVGIFQVLKGNYWKCPVIAEWAEKFRL